MNTTRRQSNCHCNCQEINKTHLDAYVSDVRAGDVVGDPVTLVKHERLVTAGLLEQLPGADDGVPEAAVAKRALAVAFRLYTKHVASSVQLSIHENLNEHK